jgi:hypothetical protein
MAAVQPEPWLRALITNNKNQESETQCTTLLITHLKHEVYLSVIEMQFVPHGINTTLPLTFSSSVMACGVILFNCP